MKDLTQNELVSIDGGNVPTSYYMDSDTIKANWKNIKDCVSFWAGVVIGFFD